MTFNNTTDVSLSLNIKIDLKQSELEIFLLNETASCIRCIVWRCPIFGCPTLNFPFLACSLKSVEKEKVLLH